ncbi:hypothetical protein HMPREF1987_00138 [Peptostreptococcaceae bacterium oral taxon 113 str. W5053]|nr:hypothetical protein HMPREF1987_00138 [Peptostreptococcaceae bacterium oral taxon 113 str. W5053]
MVKENLCVNETLFISEYEEWIYIIVNDMVYKVRLSDKEIKELYGIIKKVRKREKVNKESRIFKFLMEIGGIIKEENSIIEKRILISYVKNVDDIMEFNKYCNETVLMFDGDKKGLNLYLSDNEIILSVKKIKNGNFLIPTEIQKELIVQTILKNEKEIISMLMRNYTIALSLFSYVNGVRVLKDKVSIKETENALCFQPWYFTQKFDIESRYPKVYVRCEINGIEFEAAGYNIDEALYYINSEFISMGESCYE